MGPQVVRGMKIETICTKPAHSQDARVWSRGPLGWGGGCPTSLKSSKDCEIQPRGLPAGPMIDKPHEMILWPSAAAAYVASGSLCTCIEMYLFAPLNSTLSTSPSKFVPVVRRASAD